MGKKEIYEQSLYSEAGSRRQCIILNPRLYSFINPIQIPLLNAVTHETKAYLCYSQVQTSLPDMSYFHCCRTCNVRRTRFSACKTYCSQNRSSARHKWLGSDTRTVLRGRCESASASEGSGWSCQSETPFLLTSRPNLKHNLMLVKWLRKEECSVLWWIWMIIQWEPKYSDTNCRRSPRY